MPEPQTKSTISDTPRNRLIHAGIQVFARYGFEGATTRQLAEAAGVNQAAIPYYYGGKEPLYHAVVARIVETVAPPRLAVVEKIRETLALSDAPRPVLAGLLEALLGSLVDLIGTPEAIRLPTWGEPYLQRWLESLAEGDISL